MTKKVIGILVLYFIINYFVGMWIAYRERYIAKRKLPKFFNWILFLGRYNKYTLNTIIYQSGIIVTLIISLILLIVFSGETDKQHIVYIFHGRCFLALFLMEAIFIWRVNIWESRKNKKRKLY